MIAFIDTGINPYHEEFRASSWTAHPATFIPGYPADAQALYLTLDAASFAEAWAADADAWAAIRPGVLYYVPGTRVIGAILFGEGSEATWYDEQGHGTMVASAGAGNTAGSAPSAGIVVIQNGPGTVHYDWLTAAGWVDVVATSTAAVGSVGPPAPIPNPDGEIYLYGAAEGAWRFTGSGRSFFTSGGNGLFSSIGTNIADPFRGPPWMVAVGGYEGDGSDARPYRPCYRCDRPVEILGKYHGTWAQTDSLSAMQEGGGTSFSSPTIAGYAARIVQHARDILDDDGTRPDGVYAAAGPGAVPPPEGPLADGVFLRDELEDLLRQAATRVTIPTSWPVNYPPAVIEIPVPPEVSYLYQGYGMFDERNMATAVTVLEGGPALEPRPHDDAWHDRVEAVAAAYWHPWTCAWEDLSASTCPVPAQGVPA